MFEATVCASAQHHPLKRPQSGCSVLLLLSGLWSFLKGPQSPRERSGPNRECGCIVFTVCGQLLLTIHES